MNFDELFPDNREDGLGLLHQTQLVMLRMLKILDFLCKKYNIEYFLVGGSLLGAVRHRGFIPWDDDLDVGMTVENFEKFVKHAVSDLPRDIFFQTSSTDLNYPVCDYVDAKLRDKFSSYNVDKYKYHDGIQLDIFAYHRSYLPNNFFIICLNLMLKLFRSDKIRSKILKLIAKYSPVSLVYASNYLHKLGQRKLGKNFITVEEMMPLVNMPFEDVYVPVPTGWNKCLQRQYGDYMQLPPKEKRLTHHDNLPDPFTPCNHSETLKWNDRNKV